MITPEKEIELRNLVKKMIDVAFELDKEAYTLRTSNPDCYKCPELFTAAIKLREAADKLEYALS